MAEEFLHRADVGTPLEGGGCERVTKGMTAGALGQPHAADCHFDSFVDRTRT